MKLKVILLIIFQALTLVCVNAQSLDGRVAAIIDRPEFRHALFGIEIYSLTDDKVLYALNAGKLFVPGSVTKILTKERLCSFSVQTIGSTRVSIALVQLAATES